jgi:hypothetical protein
MRTNIKTAQENTPEELEVENIQEQPLDPSVILNTPQIQSMLDQIAGSIVKQNQAAFLDGVDSSDINALDSMISQLVNSALSR